MLEFQAYFMLPLIAALVAGDIVAAEDGNGTLKTILTRSVDRGQVFAAKALVGAELRRARRLPLGGGGYRRRRRLLGLSPDHHPLRERRLGRRRLLLVFAANGCYLIPLFAVASIGVLLSTATRNSTAAVVGTIGFVILLYIVAGIPGLEGIKPYLLTEQFQGWHGLLRTPTDWAPVAHSLWVCALYAAPALIAGYLVFLRRDVAGG